MKIFLKKLYKITLKLLLALLVLIIFLWILLQTGFFQNLIVHNVTKRLSKSLNTTVSVEHVNFRLFDKMLLEGTTVLDHNKDTLLYAGVLKVNITDWFFFKDHITLKYVGIENTFVNLHRTDSVWNYQFLADYFSNPSSPKKSSKNQVHLDLKEIDLKDIKILQRDEWKGVNMLASVEKLNLEARETDLENKIIRISNITAKKPIFSQYDYTGKRPASAPRTNSADVPPEVKLPLEWNTEDWKISVQNIRIRDGMVAVEREGGLPEKGFVFDERHIILSDLDGRIKNLNLRQDSLTAKVKLSVKDRGGFKVNELNADYKLTPHLMEFRNLDIITDNSHLQDYFAMYYNSFNEDMNNFIDAVRMEGNFKNSYLSSGDLAYFAPETSAWNTKFTLEGKVTGKVENLLGKDVVITAGGKNYLSGDFSLRGLPDIDETFIDLRIDKLRTDYNELALLIPAIREVTNPKLSTFGNILYDGNYTGFIRDFVTYGTLSTNIGTLDLDLQLKIPEKGKPQYRGKISTNNFQLGKFIGSEQIENIAFDGKVNGTGFHENDVSLNIDGVISKFTFNDYTYSNIIAEGKIQKKFFSGTASVHDDNLVIDSLAGSINFSRTSPAFNLNASVSTLNLRQLGFTNDNVSLTGNFDLNFQGRNIDEFLGYAKLYDAELLDDGQHLSFDSLTILSTLFNDKKVLTLQTNELEASINGDFEIAGLADAFQLFLSRYYPAYIEKPVSPNINQNFTFLIKTRYVSDYLSLFNKNLSGLNNSVVIGNINIGTNTLNLQADVPQFKYRNLSFNSLRFTGIGNEETLKLSGDIDEIVINDSLLSQGTKLNIVAANDISDITINATANKTIGAADISARVVTQKKGLSLTFNPSTFTINQKEWHIQENGKIILNDRMITAHDIKLSQNGQEIYLSTTPGDTDNTNDAIIALQNVVIEDFSPLLLKTPKIAGLLNANIRINDPFNEMEVELDSRIDRFIFESDSIGVLNATGNYENKTGNAKLHILSNNNIYNFIADIDYIPMDSLNPLEGKITFKNSGIHLLEDYLSGIVSSVYGRVSGTLYITGRTSDPKLTGTVTLNNTSMVVDYTRCKYVLADNTVLNFNPDEIDLGTIKLKDTLNNTATLTGKIYHSFFDNFFFNELNLKTDATSDHFILLNTTAADNDEFYGHVLGRAELSLNGPVSDMRVNITGEPTDSSHIYLPLGETAESGSLNYIEFIKFGREMQPDLKRRENTNIKVNMELNANPLAKIDVILDETTGDVIHAQGSGKLFISTGTRDPLTIRGRYNIEEGEYTFNFQTFLKTPFILQGGFIEWQGDPYLANLNIDAIYRAENVILNNIPTSTGISNTRGDVNILFKLRGTLKDPTPTFEFQFPFDNPLKSDPIANEYLKTRYQSDNNQLLNQVASLLLFNMFMTTDQGLLSGYNTTNFVAKTVGQLLSSTLSSSLNAWLQKLLNTKSVNLYTNINTADFNFQKGGIQRELQNVGNFGLKTTFLNNKLLVNVGGNVDYRLTQAVSNNNSNFLFTPDVSFEYLITPDGRFRVIGFNRSDADPGDLAGVTRRNRTGIQLSYRKNFDTFQEFFTNERRRSSGR